MNLPRLYICKYIDSRMMYSWWSDFLIRKTNISIEHRSFGPFENVFPIEHAI